jgi:hypothetical protein
MKEKSTVEIIYTPEQFKEKGFDGEIAQYMRENRNTAIVGEVLCRSTRYKICKS